MEPTKRIGIIGAMNSEVATLVSQLQDRRDTMLSGMTFYEGLLEGTPVVIVKCGVGKVNAALCTEALIVRFSPTHIINTGVAGSLDSSLDIGDLVISTDLVEHDMDVTGLGFAPGFIPFLGDGDGEGIMSFEAAELLRRTVAQAAAEVASEVHASLGRIASGDQFISSHEARHRIIDTFGACCCEMEGAAIAHVCWRNELPFVVVRAISDKADDSSSMDYPTFEREAARHCATIVKRAVELLG